MGLFFVIHLMAQAEVGQDIQQGANITLIEMK